MSNFSSYIYYFFAVQVDTNFFWAGVPWEWEGRHFAAFTMNKGFKTTKYHENDIVYANAMEGIGFSMVSFWLQISQAMHSFINVSVYATLRAA
jgi:hypothetical protein